MKPRGARRADYGTKQPENGDDQENNDFHVTALRLRLAKHTGQMGDNLPRVAIADRGLPQRCKVCAQVFRQRLENALRSRRKFWLYAAGD